MEFVLFWCRKIEAHWKDVDEDENPEDQNRSEAGSEDFNFPRVEKTTCGGERGWIDLVNIAAQFFGSETSGNLKCLQ